MRFFDYIADTAQNAVQTAAPAAAQAQTAVQETAAQAGAPEAAAPAARGGDFLGMVPMLVILAVFMFFIFRSQKKQQQKRQEMLDKIAKGTQVVYCGGILGTVIELKEKTCIVENFDHSRNEILLGAIAEVCSPAAGAAPGKNAKTK